MRKSFFLFLLIALAAVSALVSCAQDSFIDKRDAGTLIGATNISVSWSPEKPAIGDSVHLEARMPASAAGNAVTLGNADTSDLNANAAELVLPNGEAIPPLSKDHGSGDVTVRWSFRVKAAGDYTLGGKKLFSAVSVAGTSTELKKFDANGLWNGRIEKSTQEAPGAQGSPVAPQNTPQAGPQVLPQTAAGTSI